MHMAHDEFMACETPYDYAHKLGVDAGRFVAQRIKEGKTHGNHWDLLSANDAYAVGYREGLRFNEVQ